MKKSLIFCRIITLCSVLFFCASSLANNSVVSGKLKEKEDIRMWVIKDSFKLIYYPKNASVVICSIAIGKDEKENKTPVGVFKIVDKQENYSWYPTKEQRAAAKKNGVILPLIVKPDDRRNPWGAHRLKLNVARKDGYGIYIHETNNPKAIGTRASTGCIRVKKEDMISIYKPSRREDKIKIINSYSVDTLCFINDLLYSINDKRL